MTTSPHTDTSTSPDTATTIAPTSGRDRFVDPADLVCPGCGEQVRCAPPAFWQVRDGLPAAQFSHADATALCRSRGGQISDPVEVIR